MRRVGVLGASGLLGSMLVSVLENVPGLQLVPVTREGGDVPFDAGSDDPAALLSRIECEWVLNAIGILRARIDELDPASVAAAIAVNGEFPHRLAHAAAGAGVRVIHFGTDAVFDPASGPHDEAAPHLGTGVYAASKSSGEPGPGQAVILRCSIIGPERGVPRSLLGWALGQPAGATIDGYANVLWNGITSWHLAKLCAAIDHRGRRVCRRRCTSCPPTSVTKARAAGADPARRSGDGRRRAPGRVPSRRRSSAAYSPPRRERRPLGRCRLGRPADDRADAHRAGGASSRRRARPGLSRLSSPRP